MARRTKEDAEATRQCIINAAREVFLTRGVSRTTMEHIAAQANVTRGAVYWHFKNKTEIFHAMREQVFLPLIDRIEDTLSIANIANSHDDPLTQIEISMCETLYGLEQNVEMREIYEIMMIKCEYVDDFATVLQQILHNCSSITDKIESAYLHAAEKNLLGNTLTSRALALDTHLFFNGLLHMWVKDIDGSRFRHQAVELVKSHISLRRKQLFL